MCRLGDHLEAPRGSGALAGWPHAGAAGGAACGDLVRVAVRVEGDAWWRPASTRAAAPPRAAAGSAVVELVEGAPFLDAARRDRATTWRPSWAGSLPAARHAADLAADALHRALGRRRPRRRAARWHASPRRTLVAMSGGVDSAAAAQLALDAGDDVVAVTLELWADPATDDERSCCSPRRRARRARAGAPHGHPARDARPARALPRGGGGRASWTGYAAGRTPNPCVRCNGEVRFDAMLALADSLGAARLATGHYARIARDEHGPLLRAGADPRKDQSYMLARLEPALLERLSFPLGGADQGRGARARARAPGCPWPTGARARTSASRPASAAGAFLRRHGSPAGCAGPGRIVDVRRARARPPRRPARLHRRPAPRPRRGRGRAAYVLAKDAATATVMVGPARGARRHAA